jgi:hypothetical protein
MQIHTCFPVAAPLETIVPTVTIVDDSSNVASVIITQPNIIKNIREDYIQSLKKELICANKEKRLLRQKVGRLLKQVKSLKSGNFSRTLQDAVVKARLKGKFSEAQMDILLSKKKRHYSKKWSQKDYANAMSLRGFSKKALAFVRKDNLFPLPAESTLNHKFSFIHVGPGMIKPAMAYLSQLVPRLSAREKLAGLAFDEMNLRNLGDIDRYLDLAIGPNKFVQTVMVRGLCSAWKYPIFCEFDTALSKPLLFEIITALEVLGVKVLITTCDQGPKNVGLQGQLGVTEDNVKFQNPFCPDRFVFFSYDWVHCFKNIRNHMLDKATVFSDGSIVTKEDFEKLFQMVDSEISCGYKLSDLHLNCQGSDRQNVRLACQLLSNTTATMFKILFPGDSHIATLSDFLKTIDEAFDIMTSKVIYSNKPSRCALGMLKELINGVCDLCDYKSSSKLRQLIFTKKSIYSSFSVLCVTCVTFNSSSKSRQHFLQNMLYNISLMFCV